MKNKIILVLSLLSLFYCLALLAKTPEKPSTDIRLYALDCGILDIHDGASFSDNDFFPHKPLHLADPCFLIKHPKGWLLWDLGIGDQYVGHKTENKVYNLTISAPVSLISQLKQLGLSPNNIQFIAVSHLHFDHVGNINLFPNTTLLLQRSEYNSTLQEPLPPAVLNNTVQALKTVPKKLLDGDFDIFGDGTVQILRTPGHTMGHQSLEVLLPRHGAVIISGDLYHTRASYQNKLVPAFNANRADTMASMARIDSILKNTNGQLIIQHDPSDFAALPKFPKFLN